MRDDERPVAWWWIAGWALVGALLGVGIALGPLEGVAHVQDEVVYRLQARLLSEGRLWEPERLPRAAYHYSFVINDDGRRYGVFPNGWPAVLAAGVALGVPWVINPVLHGLTVVVGTGVATRVGGQRGGWFAAPLLACAPGLALQAGSGMSHVLCALLTVSAVYVVELSRDHQTLPIRLAVALGGALGWLGLTRPLDGMVVSLVVAAWIAWRSPRPRWLWALAPMVAAAGLLALQNHLLQGDWTRFAQHEWFARGETPFEDAGFRYTDTCNRLGFGPEHGCQPTEGTYGHTPGKAWGWVTRDLRLAAVLWLGAWLTPLLIVPLAFDDDETRSRRSFTGFALALLAALTGAYSLYWLGGECYGPRFLHAAAPCVVVAAALGLAIAFERLPRVPVVAASLMLVPLGWTLVRALPDLEQHWNVDGRLERFERDWDRGPALILVGYGPAFAQWRDLSFTTGMSRMGLSAIQRRGMWIERRGGDLHYAEFQPALVDATRARFPERPAYVLVLTSDPRLDYVLPIEGLAGSRQRDDLSLPTVPPPFRAPPASVDGSASPLPQRSSPPH